MHMVKAGVMEDIYAHNNHIAEHVREYLMKRNVYTINVMGPREPARPHPWNSS